MENQIYKVALTGKKELEFYVCSTNEMEPYREVKELAMVVLGKNFQADTSISFDELDSLISYLQNCREHINEFNKNSKPKK